MRIEHGDDHTAIHLDAREHAILMSMLDEMNETYLKDYDLVVLNELREKL